MLRTWTNRVSSGRRPFRHSRARLPYRIELGLESLEDRCLLSSGVSSSLSPPPAKPVIVAVLDTGVDVYHPALNDMIWTNVREIPGNGIDDDGNGLLDDIHGFDFVNNSANVIDGHLHGTAVAGAVASVSQVVEVPGVRVQIMPLKVVNAQDRVDEAALNRALRYAIDHGAGVINLSLKHSLIDDVRQALVLAEQKGIVVVSAVGNEGGIEAAVAGLSNVVKVAATDQDRLADFSNYGANSVALAARGVDVVTTLPGEGYGLATGTSLAAPQVAAVAALVRGLHPDWSPSQIISHVAQTGDVLPALNGKTLSGRQLNPASAIGLNSAIPASWTALAHNNSLELQQMGNIGSNDLLFFKKLKKIFKAVGKAFVSVVKGIVNTIVNAGKDLIQSANDMVKKVVDAVKDPKKALNNLIAEVKKTIKNPLRILNPIVDALKKAGILKTDDNYDQVRDALYRRYGSENVYFASRDFVNWAGPETLALHATTAILSGGATLSASLADFKAKLAAEGSRMSQWLQGKVKSGNPGVDDILNAILNRKNVDTVHFAVRWSQVNYYYRGNLGFWRPTIKSPHAAFAIVLKPVPAKPPAPPAQGDLVFVQPATEPATTPGFVGSLAKLSMARTALQGAVLGGHLYAIGGFNGRNTPVVERYDPTANAWSAAAPLNAPNYGGDTGRYAGSAVAVNGRIYMLGGWTNSPPLPSNTLSIYDPGSNSWSSGARIPGSGYNGHTQVGVAGDKILLLTAANGYSGWVKQLAIYDTTTNSWTTGPDAPSIHPDGMGAAWEGKFYVVGGYDSSGRLSGSLDVYDVATRQWTTRAAMPTPRANGVAAFIDGKLYVVGGYDGAKAIGGVEVYDPAADSWTTLPATMSEPRSGMAGGVIDGKLYLAGGWDGVNYLSSTEVFDPRAVSFASPDLEDVPPIVENVVSWWTADGSGEDQMGQNHGTLYGVGTAPGRFGQAFEFRGGNDEVIVPNSSSLNFGHVSDRPFAFSLWMKRSDVSQGGTLLSKYNSAAYSSTLRNQQYSFGIGANGRLNFTLFDRTGDYRRGIETMAAFNDNEWRHVAASYDPAQGIAGMKIFIDGREMPVTITFNDSRYRGVHETPEYFRIGNMVQSNGSRYGFRGLIDDVAVISRALTLTDVQALVAKSNRAPIVEAGGSYTVTAGQTIALDAWASDPEGEALSFAWDLDHNGTFETPGQTVNFSARPLLPWEPEAPQLVAVRVTDVHGASTIAEATINVVHPPMTLSISSSSSDAVFGEALVSARVSPGPRPLHGNQSTLPYVRFLIQEGENVRERMAPVINGAAVLRDLEASSTAYTVSAEFQGLTSTLVQNVRKASTTTTLAASAVSSEFGESVTFTATVAAAPTAGVPTGTVTFLINNSITTTVALVNGKAAFTTRNLPAGTHLVIASYDGSRNFENSAQSGSLEHKVSRAVTRTTVVPSLSSSSIGQAVTFTATVLGHSNSGDLARPTGAVTFTIDDVERAVVPLIGGTATLTSSDLSLGEHRVFAVYSGDDNHRTSTSLSTAHLVSKIPTVATATASAYSALVGEPISINVSFSHDSNRVIKGDAILVVDNAVRESMPMLAGQARFSIRDFAVGRHSVVVRFEGDEHFQSSATATIDIDIAAPVLTTVAAGDGQLFGLDRSGALWASRPADGIWIRAGGSATQFAVANVGDRNSGNDTVFVTDSDGYVSYWKQGAWFTTGGALRRITAGDGQIFGLDYDNQLWRFTLGKGWRSAGRRGADFVVINSGDGRSGNDLVYLRDFNDGVWLWNQSRWYNTGRRLTKMAAGDGQLFGVDEYDSLWRHRPGRGWWLTWGYGADLIVRNVGDGKSANDQVILLSRRGAMGCWHIDNWTEHYGKGIRSLATTAGNSVLAFDPQGNLWDCRSYDDRRLLGKPAVPVVFVGSLIRFTADDIAVLLGLRKSQ